MCRELQAALISQLDESNSRTTDVLRFDEDVEIPVLAHSRVAIQALPERRAFVCKKLNSTIAEMPRDASKFGSEPHGTPGMIPGTNAKLWWRTLVRSECNMESRKQPVMLR